LYGKGKGKGKKGKGKKKKKKKGWLSILSISLIKIIFKLQNSLILQKLLFFNFKILIYKIFYYKS